MIEFSNTLFRITQAHGRILLPGQVVATNQKEAPVCPISMTAVDYQSRSNMLDLCNGYVYCYITLVKWKGLFNIGEPKILKGK